MQVFIPFLAMIKTDAATDPSTVLVKALLAQSTTKRLISVQLNDIWEFSVDNDFATSILNNIIASAPKAKTASRDKRCAKCQELEFSTPHFGIVDRWEDLEDRLHACDFCRMRWEICSNLDREEFPSIRFERDQTMLKLSGRYPPVLSIRRSPGESHEL